MQSGHSPYDAVIVGGGAVGASLACAMGAGGLRVALVESVPLEAQADRGYDERSFALSLGTRRILEGLDVWKAVAGAAAPIRRIHVSDRGRFGFVRLDAGECGVDAFGYVVPARVLGAALAGRLAALPAVDLFCPGRLEDLEVEPGAVEIAVSGERGAQRLRAALLIGADGARSRVRELLGIAVRERRYGYSAVIANVTPERDPADTAYERFTDAGPIALLPLGGGRCALVWSVPREQADRLLALPDEEFLALLGERFGRRLGAFVRAGERAQHPLMQLRSLEQVRPRVVIAGNAAHTLHPIAAQGLNLSMRDVAALAQVAVDAVPAGDDPGDVARLIAYVHSRAGDQRSVTWFTDTLNDLFASRSPLLAGARDAGMVALDLCPPLKSLFARRAMGLAGRQPRLARGLGL